MPDVIFCRDGGNSAAKVSIFDPLRPTQGVSFLLDSLANVTTREDVPTSISSSVLLQPVCGVYGERAREHRARFFKQPDYTAPPQQLLMFGALADAIERFAPDADDVTIPVWVEGFPSTHIGRGAEVSALLLHDGKPHIIQKDGKKPVRVMVKQVITQSQPYFVAVDQVFQWEDLRLTDTRGKTLFANGAVLVIDWGASSIDYAIVTSSLKETTPDCSMRGTISFLPALKRIAFDKTGDTIPEYELLTQVFKRKALTWQGKEYDFSDEVAALIADVVPSVMTDIGTFLKQFADGFAPYSALLAGGGIVHAEMAIREAFGLRFPGGIHLVKDDAGKPEPVNAIVRGMAKRGLIAWQKKS